ncbi:MAG: hypothetical protein KBT57_00900 [bacterium]|nr:hypothetical protein [Candidatus Limimorpha equi]
MKQNGFLNMFINGVRRFSPALAIAGFMALCSTASAKALQTSNINSNNKAEWFSQEASDAISVMSLPINTKSIQQEPQKRPIFSRQLHIIFKKVADVDTVNAFEDNVYGQYGPYIGAALVQMEVNSMAIKAFTAGDLETIGKISEEARVSLERDPYKYYGSMRENKDKIDKYVCDRDNLVSEGLKSAYQSGKLKGESGQEVVEEICNIFRKNNLLDERDITILFKLYDNIKKESVQEEMNAVAYIAKAAVNFSEGDFILQFFGKSQGTPALSNATAVTPGVQFQ